MVSLTKNKKKSKPRKFSALKYHTVPCTYNALLIMYSKVKEMMVRLRNWEATERPDDASTLTSATYSHDREPMPMQKEAQKIRIMMNDVKFQPFFTPRPHKNRDTLMLN